MPGNLGCLLVFPRLLTAVKAVTYPSSSRAAGLIIPSPGTGYGWRIFPSGLFAPREPTTQLERAPWPKVASNHQRAADACQGSTLLLSHSKAVGSGATLSSSPPRDAWTNGFFAILHLFARLLTKPACRSTTLPNHLSVQLPFTLGALSYPPLDDHLVWRRPLWRPGDVP